MKPPASVYIESKNVGFVLFQMLGLFVTIFPNVPPSPEIFSTDAFWQRRAPTLRYTAHCRNFNDCFLQFFPFRYNTRNVCLQQFNMSYTGSGKSPHFQLVPVFLLKVYLSRGNILLRSVLSTVEHLAVVYWLNPLMITTVLELLNFHITSLTLFRSIQLRFGYSKSISRRNISINTVNNLGHPNYFSSAFTSTFPLSKRQCHWKLRGK